MKIGIDARLWSETGVGRYIRNLVKNLAEIDHKNQYILYLTENEFKTVELPGKNFEKRLTFIRWHTLQEQLLFASLLYKDTLDLVHFPYFSFPIIYNRPFVITIHDLILHHFPTGQASTLPLWMYRTKLESYKFLITRGAKKAKKVLTVSNTTKGEIVDHLKVPENKIVVTYEGIDESLQLAMKHPIKDNQNKNKYFLYVGNAYPHKNLERLLKAFAQFAKDAPKVNLILVGKEDFFYTRLNKLRWELGLGSVVIFKHDVSDEELVSLYRHAIGLVQPSLMEGFGLPALEAMANNCVVLASDIPSLKEICQESAIYFDPMHIEAIAETMKKVYFYPKEFSKLHAIGLERVKQFSWQKMAKETLAVYENSVSLRQS